MRNETDFDVVVVGGGPAGATAATELARGGFSVMLLDKDGRIKPCGGAVPPRLIRDFDIPDSQIVARINSARIVSPSGREVDMPVGKGYVGMVDREHYFVFRFCGTFSWGTECQNVFFLSNYIWRSRIPIHSIDFKL